MVGNNFAYDDKKLLSEMQRQIRDFRLSQIDMLQSQLSLQNDSKKLRKKLEKTNQMYNAGILLFAFHPMKRGVSSDSVLKSIGFYAACCLFSKTFREDVKTMVSDMLYPIVNKKADSKSDSVWLQRRRRVERDDVNHILTLTPESIAMVRIALCKSAYYDMREPDANIRDVMSRYRSLEEELYRIGYDNGLDRQVIDAYSQFLVYDMVNKQPSDKKYFCELAYGDVYMRDDSFLYRNDDIAFPYFFTPRRPETVDAIRFEFLNAWNNIMASSSSLDDLKASVYSDFARNMQSDFLNYLIDDNDVVVSRNNYISDMAEQYALFSFYESGMNQSFDDYMANGPLSVSKSVLHDWSEFRIALGTWLHKNLDCSPSFYQRRANKLYWSLSDDNFDVVSENIRVLLEKRDYFARIFSEMCDDMQSPIVGEQKSIVGEQKSRDDVSLTYEQLCSISESFGSSVVSEDDFCF